MATKRTLRISDQLWHYWVGRKNIKIQGPLPSNKSRIVTMEEFTGIPREKLNRWEMKGNHVRIAPGDLAEYIQKNF